MQDPSIGVIESVFFITLVMGLVLGFLFIVLPRRYALVPLIIAACFIPIGGKLNIAGMNFSMLRLVIACGVVRIAARSEFRAMQWFRIDSLLILWVLVRVFAFVLLWQSSAALGNALGYAFDAVGLYLIGRVFLGDTDDVKRLVRMFAIALLPVALLMCVERLHGRDPFYVLGGVPEFPTIREGIIRCQGPFGHAILAGTFGAVWLPLFVGLWFQGGKDRMLAATGIVSATIITATSGSSGPIGSYIVGIVGLAMWSMRRHMRAVRWGVLGSTVTLHLIMHDPVWFVFARVDVLSGSTGWHRAYLIDRAIANFGDWWLVGCKDVAKWGVWAGDTTNQFIVEGVRGGIITLLLFVWIFVLGFSYVGLVLKASRRLPQKSQLFIWAIGTALFAHLVSYMAVSYFDQNIVNWYLVLAMVAACVRQRKALDRVVKSTTSLEVELPVLQLVRPT